MSISGGWGSLSLLNKCSLDIYIGMKNRIIYQVVRVVLTRALLVSWVGACMG